MGHQVLTPSPPVSRGHVPTTTAVRPGSAELAGPIKTRITAIMITPPNLAPSTLQQIQNGSPTRKLGKQKESGLRFQSSNLQLLGDRNAL